MTRIDCTFHLTDFQLDSPWGEDDTFFLLLWGEGIALEMWDLGADDLEYLISEIEDGMQRSEEERREREVDELLYQPPQPSPNNLRFVFTGLGNLQALYQPPDRLWEMIFEEPPDAEGAQAHVMMSTQQVKSLLQKLKNEIKRLDDIEQD